MTVSVHNDLVQLMTMMTEKEVQKFIADSKKAIEEAKPNPVFETDIWK